MKDQETSGEDRGTPGWLELYDLSLHSDVDAVAPRGAYIRGNVGPETRFEPTSLILGEAVEKAPGTDVTPGWVDLSTVRFHPAMEAIAPHPPYVHGVSVHVRRDAYAFVWIIHT